MSDGDDDQQMQSLRAMWLSLPDEEPSQNGMAQLLAAARVKAEEMAKPSLWQRALETLRRPSVLALTTVIVLLGGAVVISRQRDTLDTEQVAAHQADTTTSVTRRTTAAPAPDPMAEKGRDDTLEAIPEGAGTPGAPAPSEAPQPRSRPTPPMTIPATRPTTSATKPRAVDALDRRETVDKGASKQGGVIGGVVERDEQVANKSPGGSNGSMRDAEGPVTNKPAKVAPDRKPEAKLATDEPSVQPEPTTEQATGAYAAKEPAITQLLAQCRSAATRGDCAAVRVIANRIAKQNAAFYRDRVSKDIMITKCFAAE